jgi:hypothetical protein
VVRRIVAVHSSLLHVRGGDSTLQVPCFFLFFSRAEIGCFVLADIPCWKRLRIINEEMKPGSWRSGADRF